MKLTIGKKLTSSFLLLAFLVLLSGIVGIMVLNNVSRSADTVAKEKVPIQYSVMQADLAVLEIEKAIDKYIHSTSGLAQQEKKLTAKLDEFDMWISMLEHGTSSDKFTKSKSYKVYKALKLSIIVPQSSKEMLKIIDNVKKESAVIKKEYTDLIKAHNEYVSYSVTAQGKNHDLLSYLLILQKSHTDWLKSLEDIVIAVMPFKKNTDPAKGMLGTWIHTYKVEDDGLNKLIQKLDKYHKKLMGFAVKINKEEDAKGKTKQLDRSRGSFSRISQYLGRIYNYVEPIYQNLDAIKTEKLNTLTQSGIKINKGLEHLVKNAEKEMSFALKNSESSKKSGTVFLIVLTLAAVLIAIGLGMFMSRYMTASITALADATKLIAAGDLKNKVNVSSSDELGGLAKDTNAMTDNLRKIISRITDFSAQLTKSSSDLTGLASSMSEGAQNMTAKSESVAAAAEEMSANMDSVAATSEEAATNINTVSIASDEINSSINEIAKNSETGNAISQEAVEKTASATQRVNELGKAAKEISKVTEVISEISEQTNLLALNATIEAARAGEAGKGFAVVASEIKQLALQTAEATNDIKTRIEGIQNSTSDTVREIEAVAKIIENVNEIVGTIAAAVEEQSATTKEISENMGQASQGLQEVNENVAQSSSVSSEIAQDIGEVNTSSNEVLKDCDLVSTNSGELKKLANDLQELVSQFKL
ncbi:MAG: methyl-accepting chemotaxis protein [Desulfobacula sp.]|uniref:methyl-accepting chemotaxis protein n=1 Tax=Desulfobacula sp. TaxID=2593537 RepID=UPI0025C6ED71|nr:methyl-accepting chemotaxis protein [Desulfobacula sp.]MCD4720801.1 methyl-accepting chemotaxis protein [Desulfobacula sp.]